MAASPTTPIPLIHLLCVNEKDIAAFNAAKETYKLPASVNVTIHNAALAALDPAIQFDAIVSPANSYALMDGGFDDALSRAFSPKGDYLALTRVAQAAVYKEYRGFAPPGSCTLIDLEGEASLKQNNWGCKCLVLCPTMRMPQNVTWDREVVYECVWTLLAAIDRHNGRVWEGASQDEQSAGEGGIRSVLMTPLATATGGWSAERWAAQTVLAIKHFLDAVENEAKWRAMQWGQVGRYSTEVKRSYNL
ncbi:macro domain-like protein [Trematosphaeria pertusa]|uniref:Macro domain-like protein n=1 Tax=Trematosphaeria pertusa TaxID=390896 RepID=A0A6A6HXW1_9PLEO|nr:macro domain-like protein [Trematosphaeria pertusa]KAF2243054.1 macro domain-like protein [Trematosphaeria pertusa]